MILVDANFSGLLLGDLVAESGTEDHRDINRLQYQEALGNALAIPRLLANINNMPRNLGESSSNRIPSARVLLPLK